MKRRHMAMATLSAILLGVGTASGVADTASKQAADIAALIRDQMEENRPLWAPSDIVQFTSAIANSIEPSLRKQPLTETQCRDFALTLCGWMFGPHHLYTIPDRDYLPSIIRVVCRRAVRLLNGKTPSPEVLAQIQQQVVALAGDLREALKARLTKALPAATPTWSVDAAVERARVSFIDRAMAAARDPSELGLKSPLSPADVSYLKGCLPGFADDTLKLVLPHSDLPPNVIQDLPTGIVTRTILEANRRTSPAAALGDAARDVDTSKGDGELAVCVGGREVVRVEQMQFVLAPALEMLSQLSAPK